MKCLIFVYALLAWCATLATSLPTAGTASGDELEPRILHGRAAIAISEAREPKSAPPLATAPSPAAGASAGGRRRRTKGSTTMTTTTTTAAGGTAAGAGAGTDDVMKSIDGLLGRKPPTREDDRLAR